jgi:hypothetical protein
VLALLVGEAGTDFERLPRRHFTYESPSDALVVAALAWHVSGDDGFSVVECLD